MVRKSPSRLTRAICLTPAGLFLIALNGPRTFSLLSTQSVTMQEFLTNLTGLSRLFFLLVGITLVFIGIRDFWILAGSRSKGPKYR
jgi:hypothetical protein